MWDVYFFRQLLILVTSLLLSLTVGFMLTFPTVLNTSLLDPNGTDLKGTPSEVTWIAASNGLSGIAGFCIISPILQIYGRRPVNFIANLFLFIGWIMVPWATTIEGLFAARIIQGLSVGGVYIMSLIIGEFVDPARRGYFIAMKKIFIALGALSCHSLALVCDWRQIAVFTSVIPFVALILTFFWPESPYFLAMKGRFDECEKSFLWLRGSSFNTELKHLILARKTEIELANTKTKTYEIRAYFRKDFLKPFSIVCLLTLLIDLFGRYYFIGYVIQIMMELLGDQSIAIYCSIASDAINIVALIMSCYLISRFERRLLIVTFSSLSILLMLLVSLLMFLKKYGIQIVWLCPLLFISQSFVINLGVVPVCFSLIGEVFPMQYKGVGSFVSGILFSFLYALFMKVTPDLISSTGLDGTFLIFALSALVTLSIVYFIVPETKDKTLQQIEDELRRKKVYKSNYRKHEEDGLLH